MGPLVPPREEIPPTRGQPHPPAIATTGALRPASCVLHQSDILMALALTTLTVGYDAVITICRTWQKTTAPAQRGAAQARQAA
ncbi:hypothetical protein [Streptomyces canus]|uniref:hypothetical protein n=1 Tax=Streptomyces canus TaxID=58343 RepID=UPI0027831445|nr:hypothetical protein [Streptomyces canus]MDQ0757679.1 uncharacterized protein YbjT (DUF2867 family) [Streptomyces canus]